MLHWRLVRMWDTYLYMAMDQYASSHINYRNTTWKTCFPLRWLTRSHTTGVDAKHHAEGHLVGHRFVEGRSIMFAAVCTLAHRVIIRHVLFNCSASGTIGAQNVIFISKREKQQDVLRGPRKELIKPFKRSNFHRKLQPNRKLQLFSLVGVRVWLVTCYRCMSAKTVAYYSEAAPRVRRVEDQVHVTLLPWCRRKKNTCKLVLSLY